MSVSSFLSAGVGDSGLGIRKSCSGSLARGLPPGVYVVFRVALLQSFAFRLPLFTAPVPIPFAHVALVVVVALPNPESRIPNHAEFVRRSDERRVGQECAITCRYSCRPLH